MWPHSLAEHANLRRGKGKPTPRFAGHGQWPVFPWVKATVEEGLTIVWPGVQVPASKGEAKGKDEYLKCKERSRFAVMTALLLVVIYLAFISLGCLMPFWFGLAFHVWRIKLPFPMPGLSLIISCGTIVSSLFTTGNPIQTVLVVGLIISLPLWQRTAKKQSSAVQEEHRRSKSTPPVRREANWRAFSVIVRWSDGRLMGQQLSGFTAGDWRRNSG